MIKAKVVINRLKDQKKQTKKNKQNMYRYRHLDTNTRKTKVLDTKKDQSLCSGIESNRSLMSLWLQP